MDNSKSNFKFLVANMESLKETEYSKLKGGVRVLSSSYSTIVKTDNACSIYINYYICDKPKPKKPL